LISAPLAALSEKWPESLRQEITEHDLANAQVALPLNTVAPAMKRGRLTFAWRDLRSRIRPAPAATASIHDDIELDLPLKVIAPLFLERQTSQSRPQPRVIVDQSIPNPFSGSAPVEMEAPVAAPPTAPVLEPPHPAVKPVDAKLSETNFYIWGDTADTPRVDESEYKRPQAPQTDFTSRHATPKEVVARAMTLPGVAGVVVALCDGLMIASHVPPDLNADTAAAFLPQIFDRVAQCTRELRMGPLNNLKFTVGNVPWHIFHVNAIYFAAFGRAGESLPTAQLTSLAGELDRKKQ
jgi:predicted regulator of Ras-like GTPase activity (Roadblock/LC7/MglB family)